MLLSRQTLAQIVTHPAPSTHHPPRPTTPVGVAYALVQALLVVVPHPRPLEHLHLHRLLLLRPRLGARAVALHLGLRPRHRVLLARLARLLPLAQHALPAAGSGARAGGRAPAGSAARRGHSKAQRKVPTAPLRAASHTTFQHRLSEWLRPQVAFAAGCHLGSGTAEYKQQQGRTRTVDCPPTRPTPSRTPCTAGTTTTTALLNHQKF